MVVNLSEDSANSDPRHYLGRAPRLQRQRGVQRRSKTYATAFMPRLLGLLLGRRLQVLKDLAEQDEGWRPEPDAPSTIFRKMV